MQAIIKTQPYKSGKCLTIYVDEKNMVNDLMIDLAEAGLIVNYEPHYVSGNYEGCFLYDEKNAIKICCKPQKKRERNS